MDDTDRRILSQLQKDCAQPLDALAERVKLSRNALWRRIRRLEDDGVIRGRVALLDAGKMGVGLSTFVMVKAREHTAEWLTDFRRVVSEMPEITGAYRMSGDLDYMLRVRVASVADYDRFYQRFIGRLKASDVSASFVMEEIKETTEVPV
ncbi:winged helix-turn-helix transcriptional regulator [Alphaproteobacteria bacterium GH1-50]|uniref:Winged helix-turn-helix transcriptional regulator n=1 Tax=Kangsaoukella pontilimi TaxID=2691042 RepID=A0A7C9MB11_9RHOB|nr:Lrp/AsnC family transcriptional regulator [Kangsaoukella pontilimi]MXQ06531.1 winged helix-turn-helix transcriptional regulator [Kangsaoukella pontilimi]